MTAKKTEKGESSKKWYVVMWKGGKGRCDYDDPSLHSSLQDAEENIIECIEDNGTDPDALGLFELGKELPFEYVRKLVIRGRKDEND